MPPVIIPNERRDPPSGNPRIADLQAPIDVKKALPVCWNSALHATRAAQDDLIRLNDRSIQIEVEFTRGQNDPQVPNSFRGTGPFWRRAGFARDFFHLNGPIRIQQNLMLASASDRNANPAGFKLGPRQIQIQAASDILNLRVPDPIFRKHFRPTQNGVRVSLRKNVAERRRIGSEQVRRKNVALRLGGQDDVARLPKLSREKSVRLRFRSVWQFDFGRRV